MMTRRKISSSGLGMSASVSIRKGLELIYGCHLCVKVMKSRRFKCIRNLTQIGDKNACQNVVDILERDTLQNQEDDDENTIMVNNVLIMELTYDRVQ